MNGRDHAQAPDTPALKALTVEEVRRAAAAFLEAERRYDEVKARQAEVDERLCTGERFDQTPGERREAERWLLWARHLVVAHKAAREQLARAIIGRDEAYVSEEVDAFVENKVDPPTMALIVGGYVFVIGPDNEHLNLGLLHCPLSKLVNLDCDYFLPVAGSE